MDLLHVAPLLLFFKILHICMFLCTYSDNPYVIIRVLFNIINEIRTVSKSYLHDYVAFKSSTPNGDGDYRGNPFVPEPICRRQFFKRYFLKLFKYR